MLHVLVGPPASGKTTYALEHAREGDIIIDYDRLAAALTAPGAPSHQHPPHLNAITRAARTAAIDTALKCSATIDVYLIHSNPGPARLDHYLAHGAEIHVIDPGRDIVIQRCKRERPRRMLAVVDEWYSKWTAPPAPTSHTVTSIHANPMEL